MVAIAPHVRRSREPSAMPAAAVLRNSASGTTVVRMQAVASGGGSTTPSAVTTLQMYSRSVASCREPCMHCKVRMDAAHVGMHVRARVDAVQAKVERIRRAGVGVARPGMR